MYHKNGSMFTTIVNAAYNTGEFMELLIDSFTVYSLIDGY